jgi:hypothetical protein
MTRKDYVLIAKALKDARNEAPNGGSRFAVGNAAEKIALALQADNPRFDSQRFFDAIYS